MLQNAYLLAKIGADTAENEQHFAEICRDRDADAIAVWRKIKGLDPVLSHEKVEAMARTLLVRRGEELHDGENLVENGTAVLSKIGKNL